LAPNKDSVHFLYIKEIDTTVPPELLTEWLAQLSGLETES